MTQNEKFNFCNRKQTNTILKNVLNTGRFGASRAHYYNPLRMDRKQHQDTVPVTVMLEILTGL